MPREATRRRFLLSGTAAAGLAAAASRNLAAPAAAAAQTASSAAPASPAALLGRALELELLSEFAYGHVARAFHLSPGARRILLQLREHERAHARRLEAELRTLQQNAGESARGHAPAAPRTLAEADRALERLHVGKLSTAHATKQALELVLRIEYSLEGAYLRAVAGVAEPALALLAAEIMAVEAQHVTLLRRLHQPGYLQGAVPDAFVVGPS